MMTVFTVINSMNSMIMVVMFMLLVGMALNIARGQLGNAGVLFAGVVSMAFIRFGIPYLANLSSSPQKSSDIEPNPTGGQSAPPSMAPSATPAPGPSSTSDGEGILSHVNLTVIMGIVVGVVAIGMMILFLMIAVPAVQRAATARAATREARKAAAKAQADRDASDRAYWARTVQQDLAIGRRWLSYERTLSLRTKYPLMGDYGNPLVSEAIKAMTLCRSLRSDAPPAYDTTELTVQGLPYPAAVRAFDAALTAAERRARQVGRSDFCVADQQQLREVDKILAMAENEASSPAERLTCYDRAITILSRLERPIEIEPEIIQEITGPISRLALTSA